jgi:hypothetical protein
VTRRPTVAELANTVTALEQQIAELIQRLDDQGPPADSPPEHELRFPDVESWVHGLFLPQFGWRIDGQRWFWCPQWWRHAEGIWRLETLWRSWEAHRLTATGMSSWSAELDRQLPELLGDAGTFRQCRTPDADREARHVDLPPATAEPAPEGWWT